MELLSDLIRSKVKALIQTKYDLDVEKLLVEKPENEDFGHYSTNIALIIAKELNKKPFELAKELAYALVDQDITFEFDEVTYSVFEKIEGVAPGFINFYISLPWLKKRIYDIWEEKSDFGKTDVGENKKVLIEYSQPNPNKPMHIGHSRNNFLGNSLSSIYKFIGYDAIRVNYVNDWGTHICKAMLMYKKLADGEEPNEKSDHYVGKFYQAYEHTIESEPTLAEELAAMFQKLEQGDPETLALWEKIISWVRKGHDMTYAREGIGFDVWMYQHDYKDSGKEIVNLVLDKGIAEKDASGAIIARLTDYGLPDKVLLRSDGTSIYSTQDLQMAKDNYDRFHFDKKIYITDYRQSDYFKQIFKVLEIFGFEWSSKLYHLGYGTVDLPEGTMSSRKGLVINADSVLDKLISIEHGELVSNGRSIDRLEDVASKVALAAYKYSMLKIDPQQIVVFDYDKVTKFDGNTGPYLLYTYARANSIIEKGGLPQVDPRDYVSLDVSLTKEEFELMSQLFRLEEVVIRAAERLAPSELATYAHALCQKFNTMYAKVPVLTATDASQRDFRLILLTCTAQVIKTTLSLLGIDIVEKM